MMKRVIGVLSLLVLGIGALRPQVRPGGQILLSPTDGVWGLPPRCRGVDDSKMSTSTTESAALSAPAAAAIASAAFVIPLALSASSSPTPLHPRTMAWYLSLREPRFKPPDWLFPVAWSAIEASLAHAGYRLLRTEPSVQRNKALGWLGWNVFMIGAWSRLFFKGRNLPVSTIAAATMVASSVAFVNAAKPVDRAAARAGLPLVAWLGFATVLTATIWKLNSRAR
jgi:tryptophan-rich sensory protein